MLGVLPGSPTLPTHKADPVVSHLLGITALLPELCPASRVLLTRGPSHRATCLRWGFSSLPAGMCPPKSPLSPSGEPVAQEPGSAC